MIEWLISGIGGTVVLYSIVVYLVVYEDYMTVSDLIVELKENINILQLIILGLCILLGYITAITALGIIILLGVFSLIERLENDKVCKYLTKPIFVKSTTKND